MGNQRRNNRRCPNECFLVFDRLKDEFVGQVVNMSPDGIMLNSNQPIEISKQTKCRMTLPEKIYSMAQVTFDAECIWCKKNEKNDSFESGYRMKNVSEKDKKIINILLRNWSVADAETVKSWPI